jgi:hypothetical protein
VHTRLSERGFPCARPLTPVVGVGSLAVHAEEFQLGEVLHGDSPDMADQSLVAAYIVDTAERARRRILAAGLPCVLGYADFEAQNLRWHGQQVWAVHDWDSLAWQQFRGSGTCCLHLGPRRAEDRAVTADRRTRAPGSRKKVSGHDDS